MPLKVLHRPFLRFCGFAGPECAQIAAPTCLWVFLARVQAILTGFQLSNQRALQEKAVWGFARMLDDRLLRWLADALTRPRARDLHSSANSRP